MGFERTTLRDRVTEGRGFKSHLKLAFFSEFPIDAKTYHVIISTKDSLVIFETGPESLKAGMFN